MQVPSKSEIESQKNAEHSQVQQFVGIHYSGPIPHPSALQAYESVISGAADRILSMAEGQSSHRQKIENNIQQMEKMGMDYDSRNSLLGIVCAFIICMSTIAGSVYCISIGKELGGGLLGVSGLGLIVSKFIYGSKKDQKDHPAPKTKPAGSKPKQPKK